MEGWRDSSVNKTFPHRWDDTIRIPQNQHKSLAGVAATYLIPVPGGAEIEDPWGKLAG